MITIEIEAKANEFIASFNHEHLSPFPFANVQNQYTDLEVASISLKESRVAGAILYEKDKKKFVLVANKHNSEDVQNFILAHELGHYLFHKDTVKSEEALLDGISTFKGERLHESINLGLDSLEEEANTFAFYLLLPTQLVTEAWLSLKDIEKCAGVFNVPQLVMAKRLDQLNLLDTH